MEVAPVELKPSTRELYVRTLTLLNQAKVPYLVGGAFALAKHAGIERYTKDLDILVRRSDRDRILRTLADAGYRTEVSSHTGWRRPAARRGSSTLSIIRATA